MTNIDWKVVWENALKNKELFPVKFWDKHTISVLCPTRFSSIGKTYIVVEPTFNDASISLDLMTFNDNIDITDILSEEEQEKFHNKVKSTGDLKRLVDKLVKYEVNNKISDKFLIKSSGFDSNEDAEKALVDYLNNKATESGRMFDDKLDELNDCIDSNERPTVESIRRDRALILRKIESVLNKHYSWKSTKNECYDDSVVECYDDNDNLMAVISLVDDCVIVDLAKGIYAKVGLLQSDEEIEQELCADIDDAKDIIADREIDQLKDVVAGNLEGDQADHYEAPVEPDDEDEQLADLERRLSRLESRYINRKLKRLY